MKRYFNENDYDMKSDVLGKEWARFQDITYWYFKRQPEKRFFNGFIHKKVKPNSLIVQNIDPSYAEVEMFLNKASKEEKDKMLVEYSKLQSKNTKKVLY